MSYSTGTFGDFSSFDRGRSSRNVFSQSAVRAGALTFSILAGAWILLYVHPVATGRVDKAPAVVSASPVASKPLPAAIVTPKVSPAAALASNTGVALLNPDLLGLAPVSFAQSSPRGSNFESISPPPAAPIAEAEAEEVVVPMPIPAPAAPELVESEPMPVPRPPESQLPASHGLLGMPSRQMAQQKRTAALRSAQSDNRSFFEKLFGTRQASGPVLAYAAPEDGALGNRRIAAGSSLPYDRSTAIYDISAHMVYLPNGTRLEAHSGLGSWLDDPRYVNERNRGATPPNVYELTPREQLFHGVRALRLTPVGGGSVFGRTGLLAHTFMLGPRGDSNGCVSFRDYNAFLRAYENGEVRRLAVVAHL